MKNSKMTIDQFCKVLDEQYSTWHTGQKVLFLECMSYSITKSLRGFCGKPVTGILVNIKSIRSFNELQCNFSQAAMDMLFNVGTVNGACFHPGEALLGLAKALSLRIRSLQSFVESMIDLANSRIAAVAVADMQGDGETSKVKPVFPGLPEIDASALNIRQLLKN